MLRVPFRLLAMATALAVGVLSIAPAMLYLALDFQSWGDASAANAAIPSIGLIFRLVLHSIALASALLAVLGGVYAVVKPHKAGGFLLVAALGSLPLTTYFIEWNQRMGLPVPVFLPAALLAAASALMFGIALLASPAPNSHDLPSRNTEQPQPVTADAG